MRFNFLMIFMVLMLLISINAQAVSAWPKWLDKTVNTVSKTVNKVVNDVVDSMTSAVEKGVDSFVSSVEKVPVIGPAVGVIAEAAGGILNLAIDGTGAIINSGVQIVTGGVSLLTGNFDGALNSLSNLGGSLADVVDDALSSVGDILTETGAGLADFLLLIPNAQWAHDFATAFFGAFGASIEASGDWINGEGDWLSLFVMSFSVDTLGDLAEIKIDGLSDVTVHFKTGRIFGRSHSDVSSYIARSIYYNKLVPNSDALILVAGNDPETGTENMMTNWWNSASNWNDNKNNFKNINSKMGFLNVFGGFSFNDISLAPYKFISSIESNSYFFYVDHGGRSGVIIPTNIRRDSKLTFPMSFIHFDACLEGSYAYEDYLLDDLSSADALSRGAMNVVSGVSITADSWYVEELMGFANGETAGTVFRSAKNSKKASPLVGISGIDYSFVLYGDPTLRRS